MTNAPIQARDLARDPTWFPHAFDARQGAVACVKITRERLAAEPFLDQRMEKSVTGTASAPLTALMAETKPPGLPSLIFHTAFCCSTLMAKALDARGSVLALKEPNIMMEASNLLRMANGKAAEQQAWSSIAGIIDLLSRRHEAGERILIKPTNTANNLIPFMTGAGAPVILLYGDLRAFLVSVLKKGEACKAFIRKQYTIFMLDREGVAGIPERQGLGLTDLQIAALVWRHQMELFARMLSKHGGKNVRSLYFRDLLKAPEATLAAASKHLKLEIDENTLAANVADVFSKNSKFEDQEYTPEERSRDEQSLEDRHRTELDMIEGWAKQMRFAVDVPDRLAHPLIS